MRVILAIVFLGLLVNEGVIGRPNHKSLSDNDLHSKAMEIMNPLLEKSQDPNANLQSVLKEYENSMAKLKLSFASLGNSSIHADIDSCQDLKTSMDRAQKVANNATVLLFKILSEMSPIFENVTDCITINIFKAVSCSAHRLKDGKAILVNYESEIDTIKKELNDAFWKVASELINCFKKLNS